MHKILNKETIAEHIKLNKYTENDKYNMIIKYLKQVSYIIHGFFQADPRMICTLNSKSKLKHAVLAKIK